MRGLGRTASLLRAVAVGFLVTGCAGYHGGWESVPYVGDEPPRVAEARTAQDARKRFELALPGAVMRVSIVNQLRTYDTKVILFALPVSVDTRDAYRREARPGVTRVSLEIEPVHPGLVLQPQLARLTAKGRTVEPISAYRFAMWDENGSVVSSGGKYEHRAIGPRYEVTRSDRAHIISIDFPVERPSPESRDIVLDLSQAVTAPGLPAIPLIRFQPARWKAGYT